MSKDLWDIQHSFTKRFWETRGGLPKDEAALTIATKDYLLHLMKEVTEVLDQISFKMHRLPKDFVDRDNVLEEMIDCQKFLWGLMQIWDFSYEDFANELQRKSAVVEQRFTQERAMHDLKNDMCVLIDIDGILANYPYGFYAWYSTHKFTTGEWKATNLYRAKKECIALSIEEKENVKRLYRQSGAKAKLPVLPGAKELLDYLRTTELKIILLTNRPYAEHFRIYGDTIEWLKTNQLPYDAIIWARDKGFEAVKNFKNICWAVDDKVENVQRLREAGITTVWLQPENPEKNTEAFYKFVKTQSKVEDVGFNWVQTIREEK
jgi:FMN phosphatase YigB (HAD superfamily)